MELNHLFLDKAQIWALLNTEWAIGFQTELEFLYQLNNC
jgi:hypothetical protein